MSTKTLFAKQAFALALSSIGITVKPEAVTTSDRNEEIDCMALGLVDGSSRFAEGCFCGDEDGGYIVISAINDEKLNTDYKFWFANSNNGRAVPIDEALTEPAWIEEDALAEAA